MAHLTVEFFVGMTCDDCASRVRNTLSELFGGHTYFVNTLDVSAQKLILTWDPQATSVGVDTVVQSIDSCGLEVAVHGVGAMGLSSACGAIEFPSLPQSQLVPGLVVGAEAKAKAGQLAAALGLVRGTIRVAQLPVLQSGASGPDGVAEAAGDVGIALQQGGPPTAYVDVSLDPCRPNAQFALELRECGDFSAGFASMGDVLARWCDDIVADANGKAVHRRVVEGIDVSSIIGRGLVLADVASGEPVAGAVIARSAGVLINQKKVCLCDDPSF